MKSHRFLCVTLLAVSLVAALPSLIAQTNRTNAAAGAQKPAGVSKEAVTAPKFLKAVAYNTSAHIAESIAVGDVNGDGKPDLVVANCGPSGSSCGKGTVSILLGNGNGTFQAAVTYDTGGSIATSVAIGDLNGDGKPDLVVATENQCPSCANGGVSVLIGNGDGSFQPAVTYSSGGLFAFSVALGALNSDGHRDVVVANQVMCIGCSKNEVSVLLGNGDGTVQPAMDFGLDGNEVPSVALGDVNGDGKLDLVVAGCFQGPNFCDDAVDVLLGNGDGTFQAAVRYGTGVFDATSVAIGDVNGDGKPDLLVSSEFGLCNPCRGVVSVLLGNGNGTFQPAVTYSSGGAVARSVAIGDINGDGKADLVVANQCQSLTGGCRQFAPGKVSVLLGNGDGTFQAPFLFGSGGKNAWSVAIADVNADGRPDLLVANQCATNPLAKSCPTDSVVGVLLNNFPTASPTKGPGR
jgi:hypothetical protein